MAKVRKIAKKSPHATRDGKVYLTKRKTVRLAQKAGRIAAQKALIDMGYVVIADGQRIIRKYEDGRIEELAKI